MVGTPFSISPPYLGFPPHFCQYAAGRGGGYRKRGRYHFPLYCATREVLSQEIRGPDRRPGQGYDMATARPNGFAQFPVSPVHQPRQWFSLPWTLATRLSAAENGIVRSSHRASRLCGAVLHVKIQPSNILSKLGLERRTSWSGGTNQFEEVS